MNKILKSKIEEGIKYFVKGIKEEAEGTKEATLIIKKYIKDKKITEEEEIILKKQIIDSMKVIGIVIPLILLPGSSILLPIIIKFAEKYNIEIMPSSFKK